MNDPPMISANAMNPWLTVGLSAIAVAEAAPMPLRRPRGRRAYATRSRQERREGSRRELSLRHEPQRPALGDEGSEVGGVRLEVRTTAGPPPARLSSAATSNPSLSGSSASSSTSSGRRLRAAVDRRRPVHRLADDSEPRRLEHRRASPEAGMVVDDQYRERHAHIVPYGENAGNTGSHTPRRVEITELPASSPKDCSAFQASARAAGGSRRRGSARGRGTP